MEFKISKSFEDYQNSIDFMNSYVNKIINNDNLVDSSNSAL